MKKIDLGQTINTVANLGVIAGIVFLAIEINQSTTVARSAARQAIAEMISSRPMLAVENEAVARLSLKFIRGEPLTEVERLQALSRTYSTMRDWENVHYQYEAGMLSDDEWSGFRLNLKGLFDFPITQEFWANERQFFSSRFQEEVSAILDEREREGAGRSYYYIFETESDEGSQ